MNVHPFTPAFKTNQSITTAGASVAAGALMNAADPCVRITNVGANPAYVNVSSIATSAEATDLVVAANQSIVIYKGDKQYLSALQITGATTLYIITGNNGV